MRLTRSEAPDLKAVPEFYDLLGRDAFRTLLAEVSDALEARV